MFMLFEILFTLLFIKVFVDVTKGKCVSRNGMTGKTVLITGANSGIGFETARELAKRGARIIMASRNINTSEKIKADIVNETNNSNIVVLHLDLSLRQSVREFATKIKATEEKIDVLIHNAAIGTTRRITTDGQIETLGTNLFGPYLLTILLINLLEKSSSPRIIFVSSVTGLIGKIDFSLLTDSGQLPELIKTTYSISKYGIILLANEFSDRLRCSDIMVNSLHPGIIMTPLFEYDKIGKFFVKMFWFLCKTPKEGAQTTLHLAIDDIGGAITGRFFIDCHQFSVFTSIMERDNGVVLWNKCEKISKLGEDDPKF